MVSVSLLAAYAALMLIRPELLGPSAKMYVLAVLLAGVSVAVVRALGFVLFDVIFLRRKGREAPALLRGLLSIVLYTILFLLIYRLVLPGEFGGFGIVATSTVVSVIIGLALQDTLGNFFAGISIHVEQPFHIRDAIRIGDMLGRVEEVTWRTTTIRTNDNTTIVFPNSKVARESLEVFRFNNLNRRILHVPAPYRIPPQKVISLLEETVASIHNVAKEKPPRVRVGRFADSSIEYEVLYWTKDYMWATEIDAQIRQHAWYIFQRNEIEIPFPIRTVMLNSGDRAAAQVSDHNQLIESIEIFAPLSAEEKESVARSAIRSLYAPGEIILRRGEPGESMFVIRRGKVEVLLPTSDGNGHHLAELESGNYFGEMALLTGEPRNADVVAITEVEALEVTKACLQRLLNDNAMLAEALSHKIAERQSGLEEYARSMPDEEKRVQTSVILRRIQRFFGLR